MHFYKVETKAPAMLKSRPKYKRRMEVKRACFLPVTLRPLFYLDKRGLLKFIYSETKLLWYRI